ncbi:MAG: uracil-DNA glycosylase [Clostridia bacterium]
MISNDWGILLKDEFSKQYFTELQAFLRENVEQSTIFPPKHQIYSAFELTSYQNTRVVIFGQDPYHGENQANGLAFSVNNGVKIPPSLRNIFKEISNEYNCALSNTGDLTPWAKQGVLLLNATLTVEAHNANSHQKIGWQTFTDSVIKFLNDKKTPTIFILWGNNAKKKAKFITNPQHLVLTSAHPSPLSAHNGFFGCNHFVLANEFLRHNNLPEIDWIV